MDSAFLVARLTQVATYDVLISLIDEPALCERLTHRLSTDVDVLQCLMQLGVALTTSDANCSTHAVSLVAWSQEDTKAALRVPPRGLCTSLLRLLSNQWHKRHLIVNTRGVKGDCDSSARPGTGHVTMVDDALRPVDALIRSIDHSLKYVACDWMST